MANDDEEFALALVQSVHCIGSDDFREAIEERYRTLVISRCTNEDIAFRRITRCVPPLRVVDIVATVLKLDRNDLLHQQRDCRWRAVAARMLCRYGGLTQRDAARQLGLRTGVAVSCQLKRLDQLLDSDAKLTRDVQRIEKRLEREQSKHDNTAKYQSKV